MMGRSMCIGAGEGEVSKKWHGMQGSHAGVS